MCGICGLVGRVETEAVERMNALVAHRGPDDHDLYVDRSSNVVLGHRRLAIIDLSPAGKQPMRNDDGSLVIVFNGEIYNYRELRARLASRGVRFRSNSDTEVILKLYEAEGADSVKALNGIFALAIWDAKRDTLFLARDHFGIKPLYYVERNGWLAFASEAKALFAVPGIHPEIETGALDLYFTFLWTPDPLTLFKGVTQAAGRSLRGMARRAAASCAFLGPHLSHGSFCSAGFPRCAGGRVPLPVRGCRRAAAGQRRACWRVPECGTRFERDRRRNGTAFATTRPDLHDRVSPETSSRRGDARRS